MYLFLFCNLFKYFLQKNKKNKEELRASICLEAAPLKPNKTIQTNKVGLNKCEQPLTADGDVFTFSIRSRHSALSIQSIASQ